MMPAINSPTSFTELWHTYTSFAISLLLAFVAGTDRSVIWRTICGSINNHTSRVESATVIMPFVLPPGLTRWPIRQFAVALSHCEIELSAPMHLNRATPKPSLEEEEEANERAGLSMQLILQLRATNMDPMYDMQINMTCRCIAQLASLVGKAIATHDNIAIAAARANHIKPVGWNNSMSGLCRFRKRISPTRSCSTAMSTKRAMKHAENASSPSDEDGEPKTPMTITKASSSNVMGSISSILILRYLIEEGGSASSIAAATMIDRR